MGLYEDLEHYGPGGEGYLDELQDKKHKSLMDWYRRDKYIKDYGWSVPNREAISKINDFIAGEKILEIGAGYGLWAKLLQDEGADIAATDAHSDYYGEKFNPSSKSFTHVESLDALKALEKYGGYGVLMTVWPPYADSMANEAIKNFKGNKLVYVGEGGWGCTGDDDLHCTLENEWSQVERIDIPKWDGIHDAVYLYIRN